MKNKSGKELSSPHLVILRRDLKKLEKAQKYLEKENNASNYPGGLNEVNFLIAFSEKIKKYERMTNYHPEFVSWTDNFYKKIDDDLSKENYKGLTSLWKSFLKEAKLKIEEINEQQ